ncbi:MAG: hypothetical protein SFZ03_01075 [Candidatus Melainabacteria bacterium]|nr:hypothetical protein [Candidatus Melainabacteria bacterium]
MVHYIAHRVNTLAELNALPSSVGVEVDFRDRGERLILQHDPFVDGEDALPFLQQYAKKVQGTLILNIKSERIELRLLPLLAQLEITNFFFLDSSFPMLYQLSEKGETRQAVRFSELESLETVLKLKNRVQWVWVDCFSQLPLTDRVYHELKDYGFRLCLVSPELQGRPQHIEAYRDFLAEHKLAPDAICTKLANFPLWQQAFPGE